MGHNLPSERIKFTNDTFLLDGVEYEPTVAGLVKAIDAVEYRVKAYWPGRAPLIELLEEIKNYLENETEGDEMTREGLLDKIEAMRILERPPER